MPEVIFRIDPTAVDWRIADGEVIAVDLVSSRYIAVNRTGSALWPLLVEGTSAQALTDFLVERYDVTGEQAAADVQELLRWLTDAGLMRSTTAS